MSEYQNSGNILIANREKKTMYSTERKYVCMTIINIDYVKQDILAHVANRKGMDHTHHKDKLLFT